MKLLIKKTPKTCAQVKEQGMLWFNMLFYMHLILAAYYSHTDAAGPRPRHWRHECIRRDGAVWRQHCLQCGGGGAAWWNEYDKKGHSRSQLAGIEMKVTIPPPLPRPLLAMSPLSATHVSSVIRDLEAEIMKKVDRHLLNSTRVPKKYTPLTFWKSYRHLL